MTTLERSKFQPAIQLNNNRRSLDGKASCLHYTVRGRDYTVGDRDWGYLGKGPDMSTSDRRQKSLKRWLATVLGLLVGMVLIACDSEDTPGAATSGDGEELRQIHFLLAFVPTGYDAPFYLALEKGYWLEEGLAVTIGYGFGSSDTVVQVGQGQGQFGFAGVPDTMKAIEEGVPIRQIASVLTRDPETVIMGPDVPYDSPSDLPDLRGITDPDDNPANTYFAAFMAEQGLDIDEMQWDFLSGSRFGAPDQILAGRADVSLGWITNLPDWWTREPPVEPQYLWLGPELDVYGNGLITQTEILEEEPELVEKFLTGAMRGWQYVLEGGEAAQKEAIDALHKYHPDVGAQENAEEVNLTSLKIMLGLVLSGDDVRENGLGYLIPEKMERTVQTIKDHLIESTLSVDEVYATDSQLIRPGTFSVDVEGAIQSIEETLGRPNPALQ